VTVRRRFLRGIPMATTPARRSLCTLSSSAASFFCLLNTTSSAHLLASSQAGGWSFRAAQHVSTGDVAENRSPVLPVVRPEIRHVAGVAFNSTAGDGTSFSGRGEPQPCALCGISSAAYLCAGALACPLAALRAVRRATLLCLSTTPATVAWRCNIVIHLTWRRTRRLEHYSQHRQQLWVGPLRGTPALLHFCAAAAAAAPLPLGKRCLGLLPLPWRSHRCVSQNLHDDSAGGIWRALLGFAQRLPAHNVRRRRKGGPVPFNAPS